MLIRICSVKLDTQEKNKTIVDILYKGSNKLENVSSWCDGSSDGFLIEVIVCTIHVYFLSVGLI